MANFCDCILEMEGSGTGDLLAKRFVLMKWCDPCGGMELLGEGDKEKEYDDNYVKIVPLGSVEECDSFCGQFPWRSEPPIDRLLAMSAEFPEVTLDVKWDEPNCDVSVSALIKGGGVVKRIDW